MRIRLICLLLFYHPVLFSQQNSPLKFERINGLSQNTVYSITKDKQGFMWIATADGLNRYDGVEMKVYKPGLNNQPGKLKGRIIRTRILESDSEELWFSTEATLFGFNKKKEYFRGYYVADSIYARVMGLSLDPVFIEKNSGWFANGSFGVVRFDMITGQQIQYSLPKEKSGKAIYIQPAGVYDNAKNIWFASNKGIYSFNIYSKEWKQFLPSAKFFKIQFSSDTLYLISGNKLFFFNINTQESGLMQFEKAGGVTARTTLRALYIDKENNIWSGDENGNVYCKKKQQAFFEWKGNINNKGSEGTQYPVYCFYTDENNTLWVGGDVVGLLRAKLNHTGFVSFPPDDTEKEGKNFFVSSVYEDENNNVWLGVFGKGVMLLEKNRLHVSNVAMPLRGKLPESDKITSLVATDSRGNFWISYGGYLYVKEAGDKKIQVMNIPVPEGSLLKNLKVNCIMNYGDGWLLGTSQGILKLDKVQGRYVFSQEHGETQSSISCLWYNKKTKELFIGYSDGGFFIVPEGKTISDASVQLSNAGIKAFLPDEHHNILWISTLSGLVAYHIPDGRYKIFTEADGLSNSYVYGAIPNQDELWISTNKGLSRAAVKWNEKEIFPVLQFVNYTDADGLPDNEFNTGAFHKGKSGNFYFGTIKGVTWFIPGEIKSNPFKPVLRLLDLKVNDRVADTSLAPEYISGLTLPFKKNNLYFRFRGIEYVNPSEVTYSYKMEGLEKNWVNSGALNEVRYNGLPPGDYVFHIRAANGSGEWNDNELRINILIKPPYWKTWWFYIFMSFLIIGLIVILTRYISQNRLKEKINQLEKRQAIDSERNRISKDMHDEIGSGLTRIALMTDLMNTQQQLDEKTKQDIHEIAGSSRQLVETMSEIIWALNPQNEKLENLLAYLREQTQRYFEPFQLDYIIVFPDEIPEKKLSNEERRNLFLVSKEALNNALKHSNATKVIFHVAVVDKEINFSVIDNGTGFRDAIVRPGANGITNMRHRMESIGGSIEWISEMRKGTRVNFRISL